MDPVSHLGSTAELTLLTYMAELSSKGSWEVWSCPSFAIWWCGQGRDTARADPVVINLGELFLFLTSCSSRAGPDGAGVGAVTLRV